MARSDEGQLPRRVQDVASPLADQLEVELVDVEVKGQQGRRVVRLIADASGGLDIDTIATLSRRVGAALDEDDVVPGSYTLEVTSPGVDRPLRRPRDFSRNVGRDVRVVRGDASAGGAEEVTGRLLAADDDRVTLDVEGDEVSIPLAEVDHGKVVLPW